MSSEGQRTSARIGCPRCEQLPRLPSSEGKLYLWFTLPHAQSKLLEQARRLGVELVRDEATDGLVTHPPLDDLPGLVASLAASLRPEEQETVKALVSSPDHVLSPADIPRVTDLHRLLGAMEGRWLVDLLEEDRLTSYFHPIVSTADPRRIFGQEMLLRAIDRDGHLLAPDAMFSAARAADLLFQLDLAARQSAIRCAASSSWEGRIFVNFSPAAIYDPRHCLASTVRAVKRSRLKPANVVFEVVETDHSGSPEQLARILEEYRAAGFRVALDDLGQGYSSLNLIHRLRPDFVKLDKGLIRGVHEDRYKSSIASKILEVTQQLEISTIAEGVEVRPELEWLRAHGADYVQGFLFARPRPQPQTEITEIGGLSEDT